MRGAILALLCFAACSPPPPAGSDIVGVEPAAPAGQISPDGFGPIHIGATLAEARANVGDALGPAAPSEEADACRQLPYTIGDGQVLVVMAEGGRVRRISAGEGARNVRTPENIGVGSTDAEVRAAYPAAVEEPAKYEDPPAHDLIAWRTPNESGLRFEIGADGKVAAMHAGGPSILYVEGCS